MTEDQAAPEHPPEDRHGRWQDLQRWMGEFVVRLRKPPRQIFANGRIYSRIRISTVVLTVAFLGVLWVYQMQRPAPTGGAETPPSTSEQRSDDTGPADTSRTSSPPRESSTTPATPTPEPTSSTEPSSTEAPTSAEGATPTTAEPSQSAPPTGGSDRGTAEPTSAAPTSAPPATP